MRILRLLLLLSPGCAVDRGTWDGVPITRAWLERFDLTRIDVVVGLAEGDALLGFDGPDGADALPVHLGGGGVGLVFDLAIDPEGYEGLVEVDLSDVAHPTVGDVLGTYKGTGVQGALIVGGSARSLKNGRGASFREDHFALGLGVFAGFEWLVLKEGGDDDRDVQPTVLATGTTATTGGTADTGRIEDVPTGSGGGGGTRSGGCGCDGNGGDDGDTGGEVTSETTGTDETEGDEGDGGGGSGCLCAHGTGVPVAAVWVGVVLRRRRARRGGEARARVG